jgi:ferric-dicitrate binding protein FerR (iron transport regulator)
VNEDDELMARHFDHELDVAGANRLRAWLKADSENLKRFLREAHLQSQLPVAARSDAFTELVLTVPFPQPEKNPASSRVKVWRRHACWLLPLAACFVAVASFTAWLALRSQAGLEAVHGTVTVQRGSKTIPGVERLALRAGDVVRTSAGASARVQWRHEITRVDLQANTETRLTAIKDDKHLVLLSGALNAQVARQSQLHPMVLETRYGRVEVLGTRFELSATADKTRVKVDSGRVLLVGVNQDNGSIVEARHSGEVEADGEVEVEGLPVAETIKMGLLAHWPLTEGEGDVARDASGHGRDAAIQNPAWTMNHSRVALTLSGVRGLLPEERSFLRTPELRLPPSFTITLWVQIEQTETQGRHLQALFGNTGFGAPADGFYFLINRLLPQKLPQPVSSDDQSLNFRAGNGLRGSEVFSPPQALKVGQWHFIAVKVNQEAGWVDVLVDGLVVRAQSPIAKEFSLGTPLFFGALPGSFGLPLAGNLRDIRIYERLLDPGEISHLTSL